MRSFLIVLLLSFSVFLTRAQSVIFKPFKVDFAVGYALTSGSGNQAGALFAMEPKYAVNDNISVGLRLEAAITARAVIDQNGVLQSGTAKASASYLLTGDYYFNTNKFRPFAGLGVGIFSLAAGSVDNSGNTTEIAAASKFGFTPRVGFEYGHFRLGLEYNVVGTVGTINNNYFGIKLGFFAGGGRR